MKKFNILQKERIQTLAHAHTHDFNLMCMAAVRVMGATVIYCTPDRFLSERKIVSCWEEELVSCIVFMRFEKSFTLFYCGLMR